MGFQFHVFYIRVTNVLEFKNDAKNTTLQAINFINGLEGPQPVIVMILDALTGRSNIYFQKVKSKDHFSMR